MKPEAGADLLRLRSDPDHAGHTARARRGTERAINTNNAIFLKVSGWALTKPRLPAAAPAIRF